MNRSRRVGGVGLRRELIANERRIEPSNGSERIVAMPVREVSSDWDPLAPSAPILHSVAEVVSNGDAKSLVVMHDAFVEGREQLTRFWLDDRAIDRVARKPCDRLHRRPGRDDIDHDLTRILGMPSRRDDGAAESLDARKLQSKGSIEERHVPVRVRRKSTGRPGTQDPLRCVHDFLLLGLSERKAWSAIGTHRSNHSNACPIAREDRAIFADSPAARDQRGRVADQMSIDSVRSLEK